MYHDSLDSKVEPETWEIFRARYGITPTGAKADYALVTLAEMCGSEFPIGKDCLEKDRQGCEELIRQVVAVLDKVKFSLKHVTRSGEKPALMMNPQRCWVLNGLLKQTC